MNDLPEEDQDFAHSKLREAIDNQLASGEPAFAQSVLNKLLLVGYDREDALDMMAIVLADEINALLEADRAFDMARYEQLLRQLPTLPDGTVVEVE